MYSTEASVFSIAVKQYLYKLKAYIGLFSGLALTQFIGFLFSLGGVGQSGSGSSIMEVYIKRYSGDIVAVFTIIWIFATAIMLTIKAYRDMDFAFVSSRVSSNLSNIGFLLTYCVLGGVTVSLYGLLLRVVVYFTTGGAGIIGQDFKPSLFSLFAGTAAVVLYMLLFSGTGYLIGVLARLNRIFVVVIPALFIGVVFTAARVKTGNSVIAGTVEFFIKETSLLLFAVKVILASAVLFTGSMVLSNRTEVRE